jgi:hypothetical protein
MATNDRRSWDLGRFVQTLSYFEELPVISWVQKMIQPSSPPPQPAAQVSPEGNRLLFDFRQSQDLSRTWGSVDDVVMGGVSDSQVQSSPDGVLFCGTVSTANFGGFASIRTRNFEPALDLSDYQGLELRLNGDGQRYKFLLRSDSGWDSLAYSYSFDTVAGEWLTVRIPFAQMVPVFRAKTLPDVSPLQTQTVRSLQLMLSKFEYDGALNPSFNPGPFRLVIQSIQAYR